jgi:hypothetical protein
MKLPIVFALAAALACAGCATGIQVATVDDGAAPVTGVPWNLAMTQFKVTITRSVTGCMGTLKGSVQVTATPVKIVDAQQRYALSSNGWWATSDITSTLAIDGASNGLNANSTDQTATVIANVVGTVGQVAIGLAEGAGNGKQPGAIAINVCSQTTDNNVAAAVSELYPPKGKGTGLKAKVDADTTALTAATANVTTLTAQAQADASYKKALAKALGVQKTAQDKLTTDQTELTKDLALTTDTQSLTWPLQANQFRNDTPNLLDPNKLKKWSSSVDPPTAEAMFTVYMAIYTQAPDGSWRAPAAPQAADIKVGVPVRLAKVGVLAVCSGNFDDTTNAVTPAAVCPPTLPAGQASKGGLFIAAQPILQLGRMYVVPLTGGTFKSESAVIALDPTTGVPTSIETSEKVAAAAVASGALLNTATQATALPGQITAAQLAAAQGALNITNTRASLVTALANAQVAGQIAPLAAQTAVANASANALTALAAASAAQANAANVNQNSALAAQTTLLTAEAAEANAAQAAAKAGVIP